MKCNVIEEPVLLSFDGKEFELKFTMAVIAELQGVYGDMEHTLNNLSDVKTALEVLTMLINSAVRRHNKTAAEKWECYTAEDVGDSFSLKDIPEITEKVSRAIYAALPDGAEGDSEKNTATE